MLRLLPAFDVHVNVDMASGIWMLQTTAFIKSEFILGVETCIRVVLQQFRLLLRLWCVSQQIDSPLVGLCCAGMPAGAKH